jgi:hypothetical protein
MFGVAKAFSAIYLATLLISCAANLVLQGEVKSADGAAVLG